MAEERSWKEKLASLTQTRGRVRAELTMAKEAKERASAAFWQRIRDDALGGAPFDVEERKVAQQEIARLIQEWQNVVVVCNSLERLNEEVEGRVNTEVKQRCGQLG